MFQVLTMDKLRQNAKSLEAPPEKKTKQTPSSTVSKPPTSNDVPDFLDFVPIENNSDDFDLGKIIADIENIENTTKNINNPAPLGNQNMPLIQVTNNITNNPTQNV